MLLLFHLSDIHLQGTRKDNPVFDRIRHIARAALEMALTREGIVTDVVIVLSGDIASTGRTAEYALAGEMLDQLTKEMQEVFHVTPIYVIAPGNHDCDFSRPDELRTMTIRHVNPERVDPAIVAACTNVQSAFFEFRQRFAPTTTPDALYQQYSVALASNHRVRFNVLNSAWMSTLNEQQGALVFPLAHADGCLDAGDSAYVITVFHHPYGWYESNNQRALRALVESNSGLVLTGHEHEVSQYRKTTSATLHDYLEGGALQLHGEQPGSEFNVVAIDFEKSLQAIASFAWDGEKYTTEVDTASVPLIRDPDVYRRKFRFTADFCEVLEDPGAAYEHPSKPKMTLQDVFVYPDLLESELQVKVGLMRHLREKHLDHLISRERVLIVGEEMSGKSALARQLTFDLHRRGILPLLLSGRSLQSPSAANIDRWMRTAFQEQYGADDGLWREFVQAPAERRAILVDDLQVIDFDLKYREAMCTQLLRQARLVVLLSTDHWGFDDIVAAQQGLETLWSFARLKILEMGYVRRTELIDKWCCLSSPFVSESNDACNRRNRIERYVDGVIQNCLLPSYPGNVLMLVSLLEAGGAAENRTPAILYEAMVTRSLQAVEPAPIWWTANDAIASRRFTCPRREIGTRKSSNAKQCV